MVDTAQIQAATETPDGAGGASVSWTTTATVKCSVDQAGKSAQEQMVAGRLTTTMPYTVTLPYGTALTTSNRILACGRAFRVAAVLEGGAEATCVRAVCEEGS